MSSLFVCLEYPVRPSSFAFFFSSGTVQSSYDPLWPPVLPTADRPSLAAALE
ncbi:MAG: hypothetical protein JWQ59_2357, partial [Cryobacterium sp.]|nr:hypothetical protein [Cryobacterium sp.]